MGAHSRFWTFPTYSKSAADYFENIEVINIETLSKLKNNKGTAKWMNPLGIQFKNMAKNMANDLDINVMYQKTNVICPCLY